MRTHTQARTHIQASMHTHTHKHTHTHTHTKICMHTSHKIGAVNWFNSICSFKGKKYVG